MLVRHHAPIFFYCYSLSSSQSLDNFEHLLPLAHKSNFRLVIPQRKDYSGSSKYTDAEVAVLNENPRVFFENAGLTLARFVDHIIQNTKVYKPSEDRSKGGISIVGWSLGATHAMAMFAERIQLDDSTYSTIEPYVNSLVLYGNALLQCRGCSD